MGLEKTLDRAHAAVTENKVMRVFTAFTRVLLAIGFIPPSIPKILHQPFTSLPETNPVGDFFGALYRTGFYYEFIGWGQLLAAVLLLFPRTAHLGAFLFLPIIANIAVLTFSVGFRGTVYITALMLIAVLYLVAWEYDRWKPIVFRDRVQPIDASRSLLVGLPVLFGAGGALVALLFVALGVANLHQRAAVAVVGLTIAGVFFGLICAVHHSFMRVGGIRERGEVE